MILGIILHHMNSKRLPRKALLPLAGKPTLEVYIERAKQSKLIDKLVFATGNLSENEVLCDIANRMNIRTFVGSENDILDRMYQCARYFKADTIVRLCADNPLIEGWEIDRIIDTYLKSTKRDCMFSNTHNINGNGYPDCLGAEVYSLDVIEKLWHDIPFDSDIREQPHLYFERNNLVETVDCPPDYKGYADKVFDVNTEEEYQKVKNIFDKFKHNNFTFNDYKEML